MGPLGLVAAEPVWGAGRVGFPRAGAGLCPLPPRRLGEADAQPWLQAMPRGWDSDIPRKVSSAFYMVPGDPRSHWAPWLRRGMDGFCGGREWDHTAAATSPFSRQVPASPAARSSPVVFYEGGWAPAGAFLNGSALSREAGAANQGAGCAPGAASMGRMTSTIVRFPLPTPAPSSAKDTRRETMTRVTG